MRGEPHVVGGPKADPEGPSETYRMILDYFLDGKSLVADFPGCQNP